MLYQWIWQLTHLVAILVSPKEYTLEKLFWSIKLYFWVRDQEDCRNKAGCHNSGPETGHVSPQPAFSGADGTLWSGQMMVIAPRHVMFRAENGGTTTLNSIADSTRSLSAEWKRNWDGENIASYGLYILLHLKYLRDSMNSHGWLRLGNSRHKN